MTISYSGSFLKLILRWKGSLWRAVWRELTVWLIVYYMVRLLYMYGLDTESRVTMDKLIVDFDIYVERMPLNFLLGFYVATVVKRWWDQFNQIQFPDDVLNTVCYMIPDSDEDSMKRKRTIARYLCLTAALCWRDISIKVRKRFPTVDHLMSADLMTSEERTIFQVAPPMMSQFLTKLHEYRKGFRKLHCYDWICIPLVYTQVTAVATYLYFIFCLIARQFLHSSSKLIAQETCLLKSKSCTDYIIPYFTIAQFLFYVGWFKVGQDLMRPFEEADDDFELNYLLDRHIQVASSIVNSGDQPSLPEHKTGWDFIPIVPHTKLSSKSHYHPPKLHAQFNVHSLSDFQPAAPFLQKPHGHVKLRYF